MDKNIHQEQKTGSFFSELKAKPLVVTLVVICLALVLFVYFFISPPHNFNSNTLLSLPEGLSVREAGQLLKEEGIIKSPLAFTTLFRLSDKQVIAGDYFFERPLNVISAAARVATGNYNLTPVRITIFEGESSFEMAERLNFYLPDFDKEKFIKLAAKHEGYLFPDTYFFSPAVTEEVLIETLTRNFETKIKTVEEEIKESERSFQEILVMASLLEKEASDLEVKKIIAGVLWKRLDEGMLLQVDAVFPYIIGKNTFEVTLKDLEFDSPYNTYKYTGLPPGPISNPGLDTIKAALEPTESEYWYYLADLDGVTHFSENFEEHKQKKFRYLP